MFYYSLVPVICVDRSCDDFNFRISVQQIHQHSEWQREKGMFSQNTLMNLQIYMNFMRITYISENQLIQLIANSPCESLIAPSTTTVSSKNNNIFYKF